MPMSVKSGLGSPRRGGMRVRKGRSLFWVSQGPFQCAMNDEVRIAANGRSEMGVFAEAQGEVAERFSGIAGLLEGTKHEVREDALFGFPGDLSNQPLVMLRRDAQLGGAGKNHLHAAFAAVAIGVGTARFCGSGNAAMADGNLARVQVFDAERVTESVGQLIELENFAGVGLRSE